MAPRPSVANPLVEPTLIKRGSAVKPGWPNQPSQVEKQEQRARVEIFCWLVLLGGQSEGWEGWYRW